MCVNRQKTFESAPTPIMLHPIRNHVFIANQPIEQCMRNNDSMRKMDRIPLKKCDLSSLNWRDNMIHGRVYLGLPS
jgi:hypothetical protein